MTNKQCTCGRSAIYPYCDGTHKIKKDEDLTRVDKKKGDV